MALATPLRFHAWCRTSSESRFPNIRAIKDPKAALNRLIGESRYHREKMTTVLMEIASRVDHLRSMHRDATGFAYLVADVRREFAEFVAEPET